MVAWRSLSLLTFALLSACGGEDDDGSLASECAAPSMLIDGECVAPDDTDSCAAGTLALDDGSCHPAGIPPDGCSEGFEHDGDVGCQPILPAEACPEGLMAVPGDATCREVMPCGSGPWGDLPVDGDTVYVDQSYPGVDSDGSETKPWRTINQAYAAATAGALVAVAEGRYVEDLIIVAKAVRLWGVCPSKVELAGTGARQFAVLVQHPAHGTEIGGMAITSPEFGIVLTGSLDVVFDRLWLHDTGSRGINVQNTTGQSSARISGTLVERAHGTGIYIAASDVQVEATVVRDTVDDTATISPTNGVRVEPACPSGQPCDPSQRASVTFDRVVLDRNYETGMSMVAATATISATVIRDTEPVSGNPSTGRGLGATLWCSQAFECDPTTRSNLTVSGSYFERNAHIGIQVAGSDASIDTTVIRGTLPASDLGSGRGIGIQPPCTTTDCDTGHRPSLRLVSSLVEQNHETGIFLAAADAELVGVVVRDTLPQAANGWFGHGINIQPSCTLSGCDEASGSAANITGSLFERNIESAITIASASAAIDSTLVRDTRDRDGVLGDGIVVWSNGAPAIGIVTNSRIEQSARAGLSNFGGSVSMGSTAIECAGFSLAGEVFNGLPYSYADEGDNVCGCPEATERCKVETLGIEPPTAIGL